MNGRETIPVEQSTFRPLIRKIVILTCITAVVLFSMFLLAPGDVRAAIQTAYLVFLVFFVIYILSGVDTNPIYYFFSGLFVYVVMTTPIVTPFFYIFRTLLPGTPSPDQPILTAFLAAFFGSGLMEELIKALPVLIVFYLARRSDTRSAQLLQWFRSPQPLQGLLLGLAAGAGFVFVETLYHMMTDTGVYVPTPHDYGNVMRLVDRVRQGVVGNMLRTGVAGFFIGLAMRFPRSTLSLLVVSWLLPAALHTLWNVWGDGGRWIKNALSILVFVACLITAKHFDRRSAS